MRVLAVCSETGMETRFASLELEKDQQGIMMGVLPPSVEVCGESSSFASSVLEGRDRQGKFRVVSA